MDDIIIDVIRDASEIELIRPVWERLQYHPNSDIDFFLTILNSRKDSTRPHVLLLKVNGEIKSIVVGRVEDTNMDFSIGYKSIYKPYTKVLNILYAGFLGDMDDNSYTVVVENLNDILKNNEVDVVTISSVNINSNLFSIARKIPKWYARDYILTTLPHYVMELPRQLEDFYSNIAARHRQEIRSSQRSIEKHFKGNIRYETITNKEKLSNLINSAEIISQNTYQRGLGVGFINNNEIYNRLYLCSEKGWLCAIVLYVEDLPVAFWIGTQYDNVLYLNYTGYNPDYQRYEVGTLVLIKIIEYAIQKGLTKVDFSFGDAFYKKRYGNIILNESTINIYSHNFSSVKLNIANIFINGSGNMIKKIMKKYNIESKIKKYWRKRLRN